MKRTGKQYINGKWLEGRGSLFSSYSPSNQNEIWQGKEATPEEVDLAIQSAREAFTTWSKYTLEERQAILTDFAQRIQANKDSLALHISQETGKPLWDALGEVGAMAGKIAVSIKAFQERCKQLEVKSNDLQRMTRHKPHGVVGVFGPFNFPAHLPNGHIVPALLAGNCVVFKPSEQTPLVAEEMITLWEQTGLPKGVLNLVQGGTSTGKAIIDHPDIDGLFFTGSAKTGKLLSRQFAETPGKILALEMGGNNPLIVASTSNTDAAVLATIQSAFITSGQRCTCARRLILIEGSAPNDFLNRLVISTSDIRLGHYDDNPEPFMGPLISPESAELFLKTQETWISMGADPLLPSLKSPLGPAYVTPGILDVTHTENLPDDELFGPLLLVKKVSNLEEAIKEANRTRYGLSAGILSDQESDYEFFYDHIHAGIINWNMPTTGASSDMPFGGIGDSGNHRPSAYYAADYCAYPVASMEKSCLELPNTLPKGVILKS